MRRNLTLMRRTNGISLGIVLTAMGLASTGLLSCSTSKEDPTGFVILVGNSSPDAPIPQRMRLDWLGPEGFLLRNLRIPETGNLEPEGEVLARFTIDTNVYDLQPRRFLIRAIHNDQMSGWASATDLVPELGTRKTVRVRLTTRELLDADGDGVPDPIDACPEFPNPDQTGCPDAPDGGAQDGGDDADPPMDAVTMDVEPLDAEAADAEADVADEVPMGNLIVNPGFEDGTTGWELIDGAGVAGTPAYSGMAALVTDNGGIWWQAIPQFRRNVTYRLSFYGRNEQHGCVAGVQFFVMGQGTKQTIPITHTAFTRYQLDVTLPANTTTLRVIVENPSSTQCVVDDFEFIVPGEAPQPDAGNEPPQPDAGNEPSQPDAGNQDQ